MTQVKAIDNATSSQQEIPSEKPISVLLAHHLKLIREGIAGILTQSGFNVVGQVSTIPVLRQLARQHTPDLILLGWELTNEGPVAIADLTAMAPDSTIVLLADSQHPDDFKMAMEAGARSFLSVNLSPQEFESSLRMITRGDVIISRDMGMDLSQEMASASQKEMPAENLSVRELEVLSLVGTGATNKEIAETLIITENTVKVHLRNILDKLDLRNRQQAAAFAAQQGLVQDVKSDFMKDSVE